MADLYSNVNGITNEIINEPLTVPLQDNTTKSIFIFGTAPQGELYKPIKPIPGQVEDQFGSFVLNQYADRSLLRAYYEAEAAAGSNPDFNVRLIRVGKTGKAGINLYEHGGSGSSYDLKPTGKSLSIRLEYDTPSVTGNNASVSITGDVDNLPTSMIITLPSGIQRQFNIDAKGTTPGYIKNVTELITAISEDEYIQEEGIIATTEYLTHTYSFTYDETAGPVIDIESTVSDSVGNNIIDMTEAYSESVKSETLDSGSAVYVLDSVPVKDLDAATPTITGFKAVISSETLVPAVTLTEATGYTATLDCAADAKWLSGSGSITDATYTLVRDGISTDLTADVDSVNETTGLVTFDIAAGSGLEGGYQVGDVITVAYKYRLGYIEANVRSNLVSGDRGSYFVSGDSLTFGSSQVYDVEATYTGKKEFQWGSDIVLIDRANSIVSFSNPANRPDHGDTVYFAIRYLPELPLPSGKALPDGSGDMQVSSFTGGSDGQSMSTEEYITEVKKAFELTFGYPCASIIVAGAYLDETTQGYNSETGLRETQNAGWADTIGAHALAKSQYVNECNAYLGLQPVDGLKAEDLNNYVRRLITISTTDTQRPANLIGGISNHTLTICANDFIVAVPKVVSNSVYQTTPCTIYAVARQLQDKILSPIALSNKMPDVVQGLAVTNVGWNTLDQINAMRYTFFIRDITGGTRNIVPADAPTLAATGSSLDRQYVLDIVYMCLRDLRAALQSFIGQKNDQRTRTVMENVAKSVLKEKSPDYITEYTVSVSATEADKISGRTKIKYIIKTAREVRKIVEETRIKII